MSGNGSGVRIISFLLALVFLAGCVFFTGAVITLRIQQASSEKQIAEGVADDDIETKENFFSENANKLMEKAFESDKATELFVEVCTKLTEKFPYLTINTIMMGFYSVACAILAIIGLVFAGRASCFGGKFGSPGFLAKLSRVFLFALLLLIIGCVVVVVTTYLHDKKMIEEAVAAVESIVRIAPMVRFLN